MAVIDRANDSYNRCIAELRTRYRGRALSGNNSENLRRDKERLAELDDKSVAQSGYILFGGNASIAENYRSGEYRGSRYMTSDDFVRYFKSRRAFYMPKLVGGEEVKAEAAKNSAVPARKSAGSLSGVKSADSGSKESHIQGLVAYAKELAKKWFPIERREGREEGRRIRIPVSALASIAMFAISMTLIVCGSVMVGDVTADVGRLDSSINQLKAEKNELESRLDLKYTAERIEADAKELGMVKRQYVDNQYVILEQDESIEIYDGGEKKNVDLATLLSAYGIELDD